MYIVILVRYKFKVCQNNNNKMEEIIPIIKINQIRQLIYIKKLEIQQLKIYLIYTVNVKLIKNLIIIKIKNR